MLFEKRVGQETGKKIKLTAEKEEKLSNDAPKMTARVPTPDHRPRVQKPGEALALVHARRAPGHVDGRRTSCVSTH